MLTTYFNDEWIGYWEKAILTTQGMSRKALYQNKNMTAKTAIKHAKCFPSYRRYISNKPDLDLELVVEQPNENWDWEHICKHPKMTLDIYNRIQNVSIEHTAIHLFSNINIPIDDIIGNFTDIPVIAKHISQRSDFNVKYLFHPYFAHSHVLFDWYYVSRHKNVTMEFVEQHMDFPWKWNYMHTNPNFTFDMVVRHIIKPWDFCALSTNPNVTIDFVLANVKKSWNWNVLTRHKNTTIDIIEKHINLWNWQIMHDNPNFTIQLVIQHRKKPWNWVQVSKYATMQIIAENPNMGWFIENVPDLTFDYVLQHPERQWNWYTPSVNNNISMETIIQNSAHDWSWENICRYRNVIDYAIKYPNMTANGNSVWNWHTILSNPIYTFDEICKIINMPQFSSSFDGHVWYMLSFHHPHIVIHAFKNKQYDWNWNAIANLSFDAEREQYVKKQITQLMLISMLRTLTTNNHYLNGNVERVFFDNYMVKQINKYV